MLKIEAMCVHHVLMMIMKTNMGMYCCILDTIACSSIHSQIRDEIGESGGRTLMVGDQHQGSSSGPPHGCAMPPMRISGGSEDDMPSLLLRSN